MVYLMAFLMVAVCGGWYTTTPARTRTRKGKRQNREADQLFANTARVVGFVLVILGVLGAIYSGAGLMTAG
jgi:hypothetical protein